MEYFCVSERKTILARDLLRQYQTETWSPIRVPVIRLGKKSRPVPR